jgi:hypothetical protein
VHIEVTKDNHHKPAHVEVHREVNIDITKNTHRTSPTAGDHVENAVGAVVEKFAELTEVFNDSPKHKKSPKYHHDSPKVSEMIVAPPVAIVGAIAGLVKDVLTDSPKHNKYDMTDREKWNYEHRHETDLHMAIERTNHDIDNIPAVRHVTDYNIIPNHKRNKIDAVLEKHVQDKVLDKIMDESNARDQRELDLLEKIMGSELNSMGAECIDKGHSTEKPKHHTKFDESKYTEIEHHREKHANTNFLKKDDKAHAQITGHHHSVVVETSHTLKSDGHM